MAKQSGQGGAAGSQLTMRWSVTRQRSVNGLELAERGERLEAKSVPVKQGGRRFVNWVYCIAN